MLESRRCPRGSSGMCVYAFVQRHGRAAQGLRSNLLLRRIGANISRYICPSLHPELKDPRKQILSMKRLDAEECLCCPTGLPLSLIRLQPEEERSREASSPCCLFNKNNTTHVITCQGSLIKSDPASISFFFSFFYCCCNNSKFRNIC